MYKRPTFLVALSLLILAGCDSADDSFELTETKILAQIPTSTYNPHVSYANNEMRVYGVTPDGHAFIGKNEVTGGTQNDPQVSAKLSIYSIEGSTPTEIDQTNRPLSLGIWYTSYTSNSGTIYYLQRTASSHPLATSTIYSANVSGNKQKIADVQSRDFAVSHTGDDVAMIRLNQSVGGAPEIWSRHVGSSDSDSEIRLSDSDELAPGPAVAVPGTSQFVVPGAVSHDSGRISRLSIVSADGSSRQRIFEQIGRFYGVSVSPSGQTAAFTGMQEVAFIDLKSGAVKTYQNSLNTDYHPLSLQFTPDSKNVFASCANGHICLLNIATGQLTDVTPDEPEVDVQLDVRNAWPTPDGRALFYTVRTRDSWLLKVRPMP